MVVHLVIHNSGHIIAVLKIQQQYNERKKKKKKQVPSPTPIASHLPNGLNLTIQAIDVRLCTSCICGSAIPLRVKDSMSARPIAKPKTIFVC